MLRIKHKLNKVNYWQIKLLKYEIQYYEYCICCLVKDCSQLSILIYKQPVIEEWMKVEEFRVHVYIHLWYIIVRMALNLLFPCVYVSVPAIPIVLLLEGGKFIVDQSLNRCEFQNFLCYHCDKYSKLRHDLRQIFKYINLNFISFAVIYNYKHCLVIIQQRNLDEMRMLYM